MSCIAIIPARGGSKRIPRKNLKPFWGKPIIAYSIETAFRSELFDKVIVSTDDQEIQNVAEAYGAACPFVRPTDLADDYATTGQVMAHAAQWCQQNENHIDALCCLYPTAPLVTANNLRAGLACLKKSGCDFVFSATAFSYPVQRGFIIESDVEETGSIRMLQPEHYQSRSQDLQPIYHDAGQFYWGKVSAFLDQKPIISPGSRAVVLPTLRCQDIDTPEDWVLAECLYKQQEQLGTN